MNLKTSDKYPPNYDEIRVLNPPSNTVFVYGSTLYNPSNKPIPDDIMFHEEVHQRQQGKNPKIWWRRYIVDKGFRLSQELSAFSAQYKFVKKMYNNKGVKECLKELATNLSENYKLGIDYYKAESLIRHYGKKRYY